MNCPARLAAAALSTCLMSACGGGNGEPPAMLITPAPTLALAASGTARLITVTNLGPQAADALQANAVGLPTGSGLRSSCPTRLEPGAFCLLLITPGALPSAAPGDPAPMPAKVTVTGANTNALAVGVSVLVHGSVHQGGHVFALDDTSPFTGSVAGKLLATVEVGNVNWSPSLTAVAGVNDDSTAAQGGCDGAIDGRCNTARILAQYPTDSRNFATAASMTGTCPRCVS